MLPFFALLKDSQLHGWQLQLDEGRIRGVASKKKQKKRTIKLNSNPWLARSRELRSLDRKGPCPHHHAITWHDNAFTQ
jgi:hypothetical protein